MLNLKKILFISMVFLFFTGSVCADNIQVGDIIKFSDGPGNTGGGIFIISPVSGNFDPFPTFCVETNEYINFTATFRVDSISEYAINGGTGGGSPDLLDPLTAYLYYHFRMGTLSEFDGSVNKIDDLQKAIWFIEGENGDVNNYFVTLATNAVNSGQWVGLGNVRVLNISWYDGPRAGELAQSQLVLVPEPSTLILLGMGLIGLGLAARRKRK